MLTLSENWRAMIIRPSDLHCTAEDESQRLELHALPPKRIAAEFITPRLSCDIRPLVGPAPPKSIMLILESANVSVVRARQDEKGFKIVKFWPLHVQPSRFVVLLWLAGEITTDNGTSETSPTDVV